MMTIFQQILHQQNVPTVILIQSTPFKLDVKISIPLFEGIMNADKLDAQFRSLEAYFKTQQFMNVQKIMVVEVHMAEQALTWWQSYSYDKPFISWAEFKNVVRNRFYPLEYVDGLTIRWLHH